MRTRVQKYLSVLCLLLALEAVGQVPFNVAEHYCNNVSTNIAICNNHIYYTVNANNAPGIDSIYLISYTKEGVLRFRKPIFPEDSSTFVIDSEPGKLFVSNDNKVVLIGWGNFCHITSNLGYFYKFDTNGVVLSSATYTQMSYPANYMLKDGFQTSDSNYYVASKNKVFRLNAQGQMISGTSEFNQVYHVSKSYQEDILVSLKATSTSNPQLYVYDKLLNLKQGFTLSAPFTKCISAGNRYYCLNTNGIIIKTDTLFQTLATSDDAQISGIRSISDFCYENDTLYAIGRNYDASSTFYLRMDTAMQAISLLTNSTPSLNPKSINLLNGNCYTMNNNSEGFTSLCAFKKDTLYHFNNDIALTEIKLDNLLQYWNYNIGFTFKATIKNEGTVPVNEFCLSSFLGNPMGDCNGRRYFKCYSAMNLAPGATVTVTSDPVYIQNSTPVSGSTLSIPKCFTVTVPNGKTDSDPTNDYLCGISVQIPVGLRNAELTDQKLKVWPNPADDKITIEGSEDITSLNISNTLGQIVYNLSNPQPKQEIDISFLPPGIYFVSVRNKTAEKVFKLVKE